MSGRKPQIDVILDTDLGDDIDDTWALAQLLRCPELRLRMVLTAGHGFHEKRAQIAVKTLQAAGISGVPIGLGCITKGERPQMYQGGWSDEIDLTTWEANGQGEVIQDGVQKLIDIVMEGDAPFTLVCIAPLDNIAEALLREPRIASRCHFVGMHGSVHRGYNGGPLPQQGEFNVRMNPAACQSTFAAAWLTKTITPLDTCGLFSLQGQELAKVHAAQDPLALAVVGANQYWYDNLPADVRRQRQYSDPKKETTILFDCVAVHLAYSREFLAVRPTTLRVTDDGRTLLVDDEEMKRGASGVIMDAALDWTDLDGFRRDFVCRLTGVAMGAPLGNSTVSIVSECVVEPPSKCSRI